MEFHFFLYTVTFIIIEYMRFILRILINHYSITTVCFINVVASFREYPKLSGKIQTIRRHWTFKTFNKHTFSLQFIVAHIQYLLQRFCRMIVDFTQPHRIIVTLTNYGLEMKGRKNDNNYKRIFKNGMTSILLNVHVHINSGGNSENSSFVACVALCSILYL